MADTPSGGQRQLIGAGLSLRDVQTELTSCICSCSNCLLYELALPLTVSSTHTISARRSIIHPREISEFVTVICHGWAARSIVAPDGHRQILSFLLPGDLSSVANLFAPTSGYSVDAITDVTYRKFKQSELKAILFQRPALLEKVFAIWINERAQADELALNIGRKSAHQRIAWLILNLAKRLTKSETLDGQRIDFPLRQRHIANATGLTHIYVGKVLGEFLRVGFIEIGARSLLINDQEELRRVAGWH